MSTSSNPAAGLAKLRTAVQTWLSRDLARFADLHRTTQRIADLIFAVGYSRLGDRRAADKLLTSRTRATLATGRLRFTAEAAEFRMAEAFLGRPHGGPLSPALNAQCYRQIVQTEPDWQEQLRENLANNSSVRIVHALRCLQPDEEYNPDGYWYSGGTRIREIVNQLLYTHHGVWPSPLVNKVLTQCRRLKKVGERFDNLRFFSSYLPRLEVDARQAVLADLLSIDAVVEPNPIGFHSEEPLAGYGVLMRDIGRAARMSGRGDVLESLIARETIRMADGWRAELWDMHYLFTPLVNAACQMGLTAPLAMMVDRLAESLPMVHSLYDLGKVTWAYRGAYLRLRLTLATAARCVACPDVDVAVFGLVSELLGFINATPPKDRPTAESTADFLQAIVTPLAYGDPADRMARLTQLVTELPALDPSYSPEPYSLLHLKVIDALVMGWPGVRAND